MWVLYPCSSWNRSLVTIFAMKELAKHCRPLRIVQNAIKNRSPIPSSPSASMPRVSPLHDDGPHLESEP